MRRSDSSGRRIAAMVDNDNACEPDKRGVLESIASKLAPTVSRDCVKNQKKAGVGCPSPALSIDAIPAL